MTVEAYRDSLTSTTETGTARPDNIPEKFWDSATGTVRTDDLLKSYSELETKFRSPEKVEDETVKSDEPRTDLKIEKAEDKASDEPQANPITTTFESFAQRYEETSGQVTEDDIASIVALGVPENIVANYLAGLEALARESFGRAYTVAGGEEAFNEATAWAVKNLSDAEIENYNSLVENAKTASTGVEWLMSKYKAATPQEGTFVQAQAHSSTGDIFASRDEMVAAMRSEKYLNDRSYQREVAEKVERSKRAGAF
ncbi:MAG: hypothetical protein RSB01_05320 [Brevundimonas sp.]